MPVDKLFGELDAFVFEKLRVLLDAPVQRYLPEFAGPMKDQVTIRHLLTHSAGLVADLPLYDSTRTRAAALQAVDTTTLLAPPILRYLFRNEIHVPAPDNATAPVQL